MKKKIVYLLILLTIFISENAYAAETLEYVKCGYGTDASTGIPAFIPYATSLIVTLLQILIPIILIVTGMIEMTKATSSGNPDNVAKGKTKLIKKFIAALFAFLMISFTTNIIKLVANKTERGTFVACMSCYLNNDCQKDTGDSDTASGSSKHECGYYSISTCPTVDDYGNTCIKKENGCYIK